MVRLVEASVALSSRAGALNMFSLWAVTISIAGLVLTLIGRQPGQTERLARSPSGFHGRQMVEQQKAGVFKIKGTLLYDSSYGNTRRIAEASQARRRWVK